MMAPQKIQSLLLILMVTLLGLGLLQLSYGQTYEQFLKRHVDSNVEGGTDTYCDSVMNSRGMTAPQCKDSNTFIHDDLASITNICSAATIACKNLQKNCHEGTAKVTDCKLIGGTSPNCNYQAKGSTRKIVIACNGNPVVPVHFDS